MRSTGGFARFGAWSVVLLLAGATVAAIEEYDYVIVGSGPGGGPLGANLARNGHSVLIIEAGEDHGEDRLQVMPSMTNVVAEDPDMSWAFFVEHYQDPAVAQKDWRYTWQLKNGSYYVGTDPPAGSSPLGIYYPRTGTLGGCGNHNAMNFVLPPESDWNHIADLTGDPSWGAKHMRQLFERIEKCHYLPEGTPGHGFSGWLGSNQNDLSLLTPDDGFFDVISAGMTVLGEANRPSKAEVIHRMKRDLNRADPDRDTSEELAQLSLHVDAHRHRFSAQTYLRDTVNARNADGSPKYPLIIRTSTLATNILLDSSGTTPRAVGVDYLAGSALYKADRRYDGTQRGIPGTAHARREVIVAGGAFNTPQLLKLSGIGPRPELESFDIPVHVELPAVGTNLQDNYETGYETLASSDFLNMYENCTNLAPGDPCLREFWEGDKTGGPYGQVGAAVGMLTRSSQSENNNTDLFLFGSIASVFRGFYPGYSRTTAPSNTFWWSIVKMQPKNRAGTVRLRSADPQDVPAINFNYYSEGQDSELTALEEGIETARRIFSAVEGRFAPFHETVPGPGKDVREEILNVSWGHHASSSCPMGKNKTTSCVDSRFRVHGVSNLRIVDASVFPRTPGAFPVLPTFLISEKASDLVLEDAK